MAESGCKCKSLSIHRPDTSGYLMYHTSNLCIIHQILCIGTISSDTSCIIHQILDVYLHLHPDERLAPNFAIHGAIHILYSDTAYTAIHGDTAYRMYHPPSGNSTHHSEPSNGTCNYDQTNTLVESCRIPSPNTSTEYPQSEYPPSEYLHRIPSVRISSVRMPPPNTLEYP